MGRDPAQLFEAYPNMTDGELTPFAAGMKSLDAGARLHLQDRG